VTHGLTITCCDSTVTPTAEYQLPSGEWVALAPSTIMAPSSGHETRAGIPVSGVAGFDDGAAADLEIMGGTSERARWVFRCTSCGKRVPARAERLQNLAAILVSHGVSHVPLSELAGRLRKS
jgi:hypothetical protein